MNLQFYVEKLVSNEHFKKFMKEHRHAFCCSAFFVIDYSGKDNKQHFDYWVPLRGKRKLPQNTPDQIETTASPSAYPTEQGNKTSSSLREEFGKMVSFQLEQGGEAVPVEDIGDFTPQEISLDLDVDFDSVFDMIQKRMEEEKIKNKLQKMLLSLQKKDGAHFLVGTVFISSLGMLKVAINLDTMNLVSFEKKSFFDIMKIRKK